MASTYVNDLRLNEMATGDGSGTWGTTTNTNLELIAEAFSYGTEVITTNADTHTTTIADGATDPGRSLYLKYTGTLDSACTITIGPNTVSKVWIVENATSGSQDIILSQGSGANITIPAGDTKVVYSDGAGAGAAFFDAFASLNVVDLKVQDDLTVTDDMTVGGTLGVTGVLTATSLDISGDIDVDGTTNLDVVDVDGAVNFAADVTFADGADIITASAGTSNFRAGVNAGNSIESGGNYNVVVGDEAGTAITTGDGNVFTGYASGDALTLGSSNTAIGRDSLGADTRGNHSVAIGRNALTTQNFTSATDAYNTAVGSSAGASVTTGVQNTLIGGLAGDAITTGSYNSLVGVNAGGSLTEGAQNVAFGQGALATNTTGSTNTALGDSSLAANTTASNNTAVGQAALAANTTGAENTSVGSLSLDANTIGEMNVAVGYSSLSANSSGSYNIAIGRSALAVNSSASNNTAVGHAALAANTTGHSNTAVGLEAAYTQTTGIYSVALGYQALYSNVVGGYNVAIGRGALYTTTGSENTAVGQYALNLATTGINNTAIGTGAGSAITTGSKNSILGVYNGNQGSLDIRTSSNNIVLSDGDGNPRAYYQGGIASPLWVFRNPTTNQWVAAFQNETAGNPYGLTLDFTATSPNNTTSQFIRGQDSTANRWAIYSNGNIVNVNNSYGALSDVKMKENIIDASSQWDDIKALTVRKYSMKTDNLDAPNMLGVIAQEVEAAGMGGLVYESPDLDKDMNDLGTVTKQVNYSILYMKAVKALQEAMERIESLEDRITTLEG
jgi:hypothetical protein